jgi:integrase
MTRQINRLSPLAVGRPSPPGNYADGAGLYLQVSATGSKSWMYRYTNAGKSHEMGLGSLHALNLAQARARARECSNMRANGTDPLGAKRAVVAKKKLEDATAITFDAACSTYIGAHEPTWKNAKHRVQWRSSLARYASPVIGSMPVGAIETAHVMRIISPLWLTKSPTAARVRSRIETVLSWATVSGYRQGANPARWKGHIDQLLPARGKVRRVKHFAALPYADLPQFMIDLRAHDDVGARALELTILCAMRTGETLEVRWSEIDLLAKVWTVPAERMKGGHAHRVPLSPRAVAILQGLPRENEYVFPGARAGRPMASMTMLKVLERMERSDVTVHGFRSTFKDWARERTSFPNEVSEAALAHTNGDAVEAAYARGDLFVKRARLMQAWAEYGAKTPAAGQVIALRAAG